MKHHTPKLLLGLSLLGATTLIGFSPPASAKSDKDVKQARKEVKEARKDVRRADNPEERRDAREDLRGEKRDLREEQRENRPGYVRPGYVRPGYVRPGYEHPGFGFGHVNGVNSTRTIEGVVTTNLAGNDFKIRANNGQTVTVLVPGGEPRGLNRNDIVRATGSYRGATFVARNATILRNR